jgi:peptidoglycan/xylan/chitin deacetylase (PgdA/CDA1 family)
MSMIASLWRKAARVARDPMGATNKVLRGVGLPELSSGAQATGEAAPVETGEAIRAYGRLARAAGIDRLYLFLSFDCDTDEDIAAAVEIDPWLRKHGIRTTYAVPGRQLEKGAGTWRRLAEAGATFMNHGGLPHAERRDDRYHSITFYAEMSPEEVVADIERGDRCVRNFVGVAPRGFRAPHFGLYQRPEQIELVHATARRLGYAYCSTTIPAYALSHGPLVRLDGLIEIPCFGSWRAPESILDSWTYLADRRNYRLQDTYYELFAETVERMLGEGIPGILTYYADPSHVLDQAPFHRAIELIAARGVPSVAGDDLVRRFQQV